MANSSTDKFKLANEIRTSLNANWMYVLTFDNSKEFRLAFQDQTETFKSSRCFLIAGSIDGIANNKIKKNSLRIISKHAYGMESLIKEMERIAPLGKWEKTRK